MIFAPHILQVKVITPMDKDEFGRLFPEQVVNTGRRYASAVVMITLPKSFHLITALCIVRIIMWYARRELLSRLVMKYVAWMVIA